MKYILSKGESFTAARNVSKWCEMYYWFYVSSCLRPLIIDSMAQGGQAGHWAVKKRILPHGSLNVREFP